VSAKTKPYKKCVTRKGKTVCVCRHCDKNGWDAYMLQGDLWRMVLPPDVEPRYGVGFVCFRCALESIDRPLYREDITGGTEDDYPSLGDGSMGELEIGIRFPKRDAKRKTHAIHIMGWVAGFDDPVGEIISKYDWLLGRLALQASKVLVRQNYFGDKGDKEKSVTIGSIALK
jgi:hypothetical protein